MSDPTSKPARSAAAETGQLQTLHRALDVLEVLAAGDSTVAGLAEELGLARPTVHRLLATLTSRGYVWQDASTGRYRVGIRSLEIGAAFSAQNPEKDLARPIMRELNQQFNETVTLAMLDGDEAVYVEVLESSQTLRIFARIGARVPLYATGVGKALLMGFSEAEWKRYFKGRTLQAFNPNTVTSAEALWVELQRAHEKGYVLDREEYHAGVRCAAAPVYNHSGRIVGALSMSGPAYRIVDKFWLTIAGAVAAAAREVSRSLGHRPTPARRGF